MYSIVDSFINALSLTLKSFNPNSDVSTISFQFSFFLSFLFFSFFFFFFFLCGFLFGLGNLKSGERSEKLDQYVARSYKIGLGVLKMELKFVFTVCSTDNFFSHMFTPYR